MGRGPARPIKFSEFGPRPGPAHHIFNFSRLGPARPIKFSKVLARLGPAHHIFKSLGPARHNFQIGPAWPGPDKRPMTSPAKYKAWSRTRIRISLRNANCLSSFKFKETTFFLFTFFFQLIIQRVPFEQHTKKGVFSTVRTEAYQRYIPPVLPVPDTSVSSHQYRYRTLR